MSATATLRLRLDAPQEAAAALAPDDPGMATLLVEGSTLVVEATSDSAMGLLRTLDDVLSCLRATGID